MENKNWFKLLKESNNYLNKESGYLPIVTVYELITWLRKMGYYRENQEGSHGKYCTDNPKPGKARCVEIVDHGSGGRDYDSALFRKLLKEMGIDVHYVAQRGLPKKMPK